MRSLNAICSLGKTFSYHGFSASLAMGLILSGCGGGGGGTTDSNNITPRVSTTTSNSSSTIWSEGVFEAPSAFKDLCEAPRTTNDSVDIPGTALDEKFWLRSWTNETYFWYDEVIDQDPNLFESPNDYFAVLKTNETTASGAPRDQFHFSVNTEENQARTQLGVSAGYGMNLVLVASAPPREIRVADVEPGSPADLAGIARGAEILVVDGVDAINGGPAEGNNLILDKGGIEILNDGLFPSDVDESHVFVIQDIDADEPREITLVSDEILSTPVRNERVIETPTGNVGYILFNDHIRTAESLLVDAVNELNSGEGIDDLVLDLRYNGGGFLFIASQLAYMIAGPEQISGNFFETLVFNDKFPVFNPQTGEINEPIPFFTATSTTPSERLPTLGLERVFVLASSNTCSASESIINGLRGVGVEVILIGDTTCGKPYGFYATDNCGTSYFTVQFQAQNAQGFGEYADGFAPADDVGLGEVGLLGCSASDDFNRALGDTEERMLATALRFRETGSCALATESTTANTFGKTTVNGSDEKPTVMKPVWFQNRDMSMPDALSGEL